MEGLSTLLERPTVVLCWSGERIDSVLIQERIWVSPVHMIQEATFIFSAPVSTMEAPTMENPRVIMTMQFLEDTGCIPLERIRKLG